MKRTHAIDNDEVNKTILLPQLFGHLQPATDTKQRPSLEPKTWLNVLNIHGLTVTWSFSTTIMSIPSIEGFFIGHYIYKKYKNQNLKYNALEFGLTNILILLNFG